VSLESAPPPSPGRRDAALTVSLVVFCQGFNMLSLGGIALFLPLIREDLHISFAQAGMLSAAAYPVVLFGGWHLPAILPQSDSLHTLLWDAHFYLAFAFFALILLHVAAALY